MTGGTQLSVMPPAHALLALLPHRDAAGPADLARGIDDLRPLMEAVPVYEGSSGSDRMVEVVESLPDGPPGHPPRRRQGTTVWAEAHETPAGNPEDDMGQEGAHE